MNPVLWFLIGSAATLAVTLALVARDRRRREVAVRAQLAELELRANAPKVVHNTVVIGETKSLDQLARAVGSELATLSSGVEGHAQLLCEGIGDPELVAERAERLWSATRRVRHFAEKVQSFAPHETRVLGPVCLASLLHGLREELENHVGRPLGLTIEAPTSVPKALAERQSLQYAALFAIETLLIRDSTARRLVLIARAGFPDDAEDEEVSMVQLVFELHGEARGSNRANANPDDQLQLAWVAAKNLLEAQNGSIALEEHPGFVTTATLTLRACETQPRIGPTGPRSLDHVGAPQRVPHAFAGALIVEPDLSVRELIAEEVGRSGRKPVTLGDAASAASLYERTPERFELLVLATANRGTDNEPFATAALTKNPNLRVLLIGPDKSAIDRIPVTLHQRVHFIRKPFGALEIRDALAGLEDSSVATVPTSTEESNPEPNTLCDLPPREA